MRKRSLTNGSIMLAGLLALAGAGVAVASAGESAGPATPLAVAPPASSAVPTPSGSPAPTHHHPSASPSTNPSSGTGDPATRACADVFRATTPARDAVGSLCTAVTRTDGIVSSAAVTFGLTDAACRGNVFLRLSGLYADGAEFAFGRTVACASGEATASFAIERAAAPGTEICGMLFSEDRFTAALACVRVDTPAE